VGPTGRAPLDDAVVNYQELQERATRAVGGTEQRV